MNLSQNLSHLKYVLIVTIYFFHIPLLFSIEIPSRLLEDEKNNIKIHSQASPLVVYVHNIQRVEDFFFNTFEVQAGTGSGFVWDNKGHIVTNFHVVQDAREIKISIREGKSVIAKVVGAEPRKDIAVLKLSSTKDLPTVKGELAFEIADSSKLLVGQKAIAIGNPFGLDRSFTTGVISALGRQVPGAGGVSIRDMIQTDASINPGNSGGPLLDSAGALIGMNTAIYSASGSSAGVGFAVPSNIIKRIVDQIIKYGRVIQPGLGFQRVDDSIARRLGISGVLVAEVMKNTPAALSGLRGTMRSRSGEIRLGDIIIAVDGKKITNYDDLYSSLEGKKVGDEVEVIYIRNDKKIKVKIRLVDVSVEG